MRNSQRLWGATVLALALLLSACSGGDSSPATAEPVAEQAEVAEPAAEVAEEESLNTVQESTEPKVAEAEVSEAEPEIAEVEAAEAEVAEAEEEEVAPEAGNYPAWASVPLTDVRSGETFTLDSFAGQVVIMEMMAVWCPFCDQQQAEIKKAIDQLGEGVVGVSIDVDPGETAEIVTAHANDLNLPWHFALAGPELSGQLRQAYGPQVVTPPATPVIIIGPDGTAQLTPNGIKNADRLVELVGQVRP